MDFWLSCLHLLGLRLQEDTNTALLSQIAYDKIRGGSDRARGLLDREMTVMLCSVLAYLQLLALIV